MEKSAIFEIKVKVEISYTERSYTSLEAYTACHLIPLDKNSRVRPIGVGEMLRGIVGKAIVSVI